MHNGIDDLRSLGINNSDLDLNDIIIYDFALQPYFRNESEGTHCSLADLSIVLNKTIQKYDKKERIHRGHNVEIDARHTLKIGLKILELQDKGIMDYTYHYISEGLSRIF